MDGIECWTCEDEVREIPGRPVEEWKIAGGTAIPEGRYRVIHSWSERFNRSLPFLVDVPGFSGIRIHPGNTASDTEGCILPGITRNEHGVQGSRMAFNILNHNIVDALSQGQEVWITVRNPPQAKPISPSDTPT